MSGRMIVIVRTPIYRTRLKRLESWKVQQESYRWQFGKLWEISVFPLTKLIMDVPGTSPKVTHITRHSEETGPVIDMFKTILETFLRDLPLELNLFHDAVPILIIAPLVVMLFLVLVQAILSKYTLRNFSFRKHLSSALLMKLSSTIIASLALYLFGVEQYLAFKPKTFFIAMMLFSSAVEFPLFLSLYRFKGEWKRSAIRIVALNALAFSLLFCTEKLLWAGSFIYYHHKQRQAQSGWNHREILAGEPGFVYTTVNIPKDRLERYSIADDKVERFESISFFNVGTSWNVSAGKLVCRVDTTGNYAWASVFSILSIPDFKRISFVNVMKTPIGMGEYHGEMSPYLDRSGNYLAMIEPLGRIVAQKTSTTHYEYGEKARIHICSAKSGEELFQYPELVLGAFDGGFDWSPDAKKIVFTNYRDKNFFLPDERSMSGPRSVSLFDKYPKYLYVYDLQSRHLTELCEGARPSWSPDGKSILFTKGRRPYVYSLETGQTRKLFDLDSYRFKWSPTGRNIICAANGHLVAVNVADPKKIMIIKRSGVLSEYYWTE